MGLSVFRLLLPAVLAMLCLVAATPSYAQFSAAEQAVTMDAAATVEGGGSSNAASAAPNNNQPDDNGADAAPADQPAPEPSNARAGKTDKWNDKHSVYRSRTPYVSWIKLLGVLAIFIFWIGMCDWANRACQLYKLGYAKWNAILVFSGVAGLMGVLFIPMLAVSLPVYALSVIVPFIIFAVIHNRSVQQHQRVFTKEWFRYEFARVANKFGMKMDAEIKAAYEKGAPVDLIALGGPDERSNQANLIEARQSPGYLLVKDMIEDMIDRRSEKVLLDYGSESVSVRHYVDGVWDTADPRDREGGDVMLAAMKQLSNLNVNERKKKQASEFAARYDGANYMCPIVSQGVKTGERVMVSLLSPGVKDLDTFAKLGIRDKLAEQWSEALLLPQGLLVVSSLPDGGLTTTVDVSLRETDRLMRDVFSIEEKSEPEHEIENIAQHFYDASAGESPGAILPKLVRMYPDFYVCRDFTDAESAKALLDEALEDRLLLTTTRAKDPAEAMLRILQKKAPHKEFVKAIQAVLNCRLIRLLCDECKVGYEPAPELLKKLRIPAGKVELLYRTPTAEESPKPCPKCRGTGYHGRTGIFELLVVDDAVREALLKAPKLDTVKKAARAAGMRTLQEEGGLLIAKGATSLKELQRILKQ